MITCIAILLGGCATVHPPKVEYRLNAKTPSQSFPQNECTGKSLKVAEAFSSSTLMSLSMYYVEGVNKQFAYSQAQWAVAPNYAISEKLLTLARDTKLFKSVQVSKSRSKNDLILETNIEEFMQYFSADFKESHAKVGITISLIDANTNSVLSTKKFNSKVDAKTLDADGGVVALDEALFEVLTEMNAWFSKVCP